MTRRTQRVLVLTYWSFGDALVQTYTLPYVRQIAACIGGGEVHLVTLEQESRAIAPARRDQIRRQLAAEGIRWLPTAYSKFGPMALLRSAALVARLWLLIMTRRVTHIHCWCTPAGALGYLLSVSTGRPLILDSYEPHADSMVENGTWSEKGLAYRLLLWLETRQSRRARTAIGLTSSMRDYAFRRYGASFDQYFVKPACVDLKAFDPAAHDSGARREELGWSKKVVGVYAGKLGGIYFSDEFFAFVRAAWDLWGDRFRLLLMTDTSEEVVLTHLRRIGVPAEVVRTSFEPHERVAAGLALADFAVNPVKPVPSKRHCTSIKDTEYWAMGLPVLLPPAISDDSELVVSYRAGAVVEEFSVEGWGAGLRVIDDMLRTEPRADRTARIRTLVAEQRSSKVAEAVYRSVYSC